MAEGIGEAGFLQVDDILQNIVSEWVLNQMICMLSDLADQLGLLTTRCMVNAALKHTAPMTVSADRDTMDAHRVKNELRNVSEFRVKDDD